MKRHFLGGCVPAKLTAELGGTDSDLVLYVDDLTGWDFLPGQVFEVSVDRETPFEEKILCVIGTRNSDGTGTLTVYQSQARAFVGRGWDDTFTQRHQVGASVEHIWSSRDATQALYPRWGELAGKD